jgi:Protein of unknown function with PCYCGC motif
LRGKPTLRLTELHVRCNVALPLAEIIDTSLRIHLYSATMKRLLTLFVVGFLTLGVCSGFDLPDNTPAYEKQPAAAQVAPILSGNQLSGPYFQHSYQVTVYQMAEKIPNVLRQEPCYCRCDRTFGHHSLHSCFESRHGATCSTCMQEVLYAYQQTKIGRTPDQIRVGIERRDWEYVVLESAAP